MCHVHNPHHLVTAINGLFCLRIDELPSMNKTFYSEENDQESQRGQAAAAPFIVMPIFHSLAASTLWTGVRYNRSYHKGIER